MFEKVIYSKEKILLLEAVAQMDLPILVEGKVATGKSSVAQFIKSISNKKIYDLVEPYTDFDSKEDFDVWYHVDGNSLSNVIFVYQHSVGSRGILPDAIDEVKSQPHISIKCFHTDEGVFIKVSLNKKDSQDLDNTLNPFNPVVIVKGLGSSNYPHKFLIDNNVPVMDLKTTEDFDSVQKIITGRKEMNKLATSYECNFNPICFKCDLRDLLEYTENNGVRSLLHKLFKLGILFYIHFELELYGNSVLDSYASEVIKLN